MNDGMVAFVLGLCIGGFSFTIVCVTLAESSLDSRCSTACAPLVGDDREGECQCATADGWKPLKQSTSEDAK